jgi:hypothetical protein
MRTADKKYFDKYAIDPIEEEFGFSSIVEGWVDDYGDEVPEPNEFYEDEWDDLV